MFILAAVYYEIAPLDDYVTVYFGIFPWDGHVYNIYNLLGTVLRALQILGHVSS